MNNSILKINKPFDELAGTYDNDFTHTEIGRILRNRTHELMIKYFAEGDNLLEINCGTGEDALFLGQRGIRITAMDASVAMLNQARKKITNLGLEHVISTRHGYFEELDTILSPGEQFDGIVSNFGGLNCAEDHEILAKLLTQRVKPGGYLFLCVMGRWLPWEWIYLGCKGKFSRIWKRIRGRIEWRGQTIRYISPGELIQCFIPYCELVRVSGLGFLLPPTYAASYLSRYPALLMWLNKFEMRIQSIPGVAQLSDHFIVIFKKKVI